MRQDPIASAYARALIELADERGELETVLEEVEFLLELLGTDADFRTFVLTPGIDVSKKREVLDRVFRERLTATTLDTFQVVVSKGRAAFIEDVLRQFRALHDEKIGRLHVEAETAVALSDDRSEGLQSSLATKLGKSIVLSNVVHPEILGGLVLRYGDLVVDGSVRSRLRDIAARIDVKKPGSEFIHED